MFENIINFFKNLGKSDKSNKKTNSSKYAAKERLHLVLMQDRANVSADFLDLMKQEIIEVIKKYVDVDESEIDVRMTNKQNADGTNGAPALYANIPILNIKNEVLVEKKKEAEKNEENKTKQEESHKESINDDASKEEKNEEEKHEKIEENKDEEKTKDTNEPVQEEVSKKVEETAGQN